MIPPGTPGPGPRQLAATRVALALCLARERHDPEGLRCLETTLPRPVPIGALIGAVRALARDVAAGRGLRLSLSGADRGHPCARSLPVSGSGHEEAATSAPAPPCSRCGHPADIRLRPDLCIRCAKWLLRRALAYEQVLLAGMAPDRGALAVTVGRN